MKTDVDLIAAIALVQRAGYKVTHPSQAIHKLSWHRAALVDAYWQMEPGAWDIFKWEATHKIAGQLTPEHLEFDRGRETQRFSAFLRILA